MTTAFLTVTLNTAQIVLLGMQDLLNRVGYQLEGTTMPSQKVVLTVSKNKIQLVDMID